MLTGMTLDTGANMAPTFILTLNNQGITRNISERLISLSLSDNRGFEADHLDIELDDSDGLIELPTRGAVRCCRCSSAGRGRHCSAKGNSRWMKSISGAHRIP